MSDLIERLLNAGRGEDCISSNVPNTLLREAAAALEAAREDACVLRRDNERLAEALRPHIEDLERSAVVLDQYPSMAQTAAEMRKAAAELRAALHPTAAIAAANGGTHG